jgi:hypothetical protein
VAVRSYTCFEEDRWIFGFDSGIVRGGVAAYNVDEDGQAFTFLKAAGYRYTQFTSITRFGDYYIGGLGYSASVLVSKDLYYWYLLYIDPTSSRYKHFVNATAWRDKIVAVTGKELLIFDLNDVEEAFGRKPFLTPYKAYLDNARGLLYVLKRLPWIPRV